MSMKHSLKKYVLLLLLLGIIIGLNTNWNTMPALGKFLDPYQGCWQNASVETDKKIIYDMKGLSQPVEVRYDERLVPHIFAMNNLDAIFIQGYLHAKFRLWQMDMTTRLASGRLSEVAGEKTLKLDREMRRKGMVYGAENSLKVMEADPESKQILDAYRDGVNSFIQHLHYKTYPLEYKLMGFEPELWNNVKTSLMIKFMADKLSGYTEDFELTLAKKLFGSTFDILYPEHQDEEFVVIPSQSKKSTTTSDSLVSLDNIHTSLLLATASNDNRDRNEHAGIGSNNWAVSGSKTISGKPMLCNDPHLPLNLPAIWYENQLNTPTMNVYGVSLPGAPHVVIGFNDSIAWGFTNGYRDVKDFYTIQCKDASKKEYWLDGKYEPSTIKIETIKIKGKPDFIDTVAYTKLGIVMYDPSFPHKGYEGQCFAVNWMAHRGSNELKALTKLNQSNNYTDYVNAIMDFHCPHQNIVFASASGDIAMWSQGLFIHKKEQQGRFIEDGTAIQSAWGNVLPASENPHCLNPARGFVMSANQMNTDKEYPFYYNGLFTEERSKRLTKLLSNEKKFTVQDMMTMQNDTYWQDASEILPILMANLDSAKLTATQQQYLHELTQWNYYTPPESHAAILYSLWYSQLEKDIYDDEFGRYLNALDYPKIRVTLQLLKHHPDFSFFDDISTTQKESMKDIVLASFSEMCRISDTLKQKNWYAFKHTTAEHLSKIPAFSVQQMMIGGGKGIVNAASEHTGPSWRMIVHFTNPIEAYGIYPGGESGNVGSPYYINMLGDWVKGSYYRLHFAHAPNDIQ